MIQENEFSEEELELIYLSQKASDAPVSLEVIAMNAMKEKFQDAKGNFTIPGEPDKKWHSNCCIVTSTTNKILS